MSKPVLTGEFLYEFELSKAANKVINQLLELKPGETIVITADTQSDPRVVNATAQAAFAAGGLPMVVWMATPPGPARVADPYIPADPLLGALLRADCWIEYNRQYLNYSKTSETAWTENKKLRYLILPGLCVDIFIRLFANVDQKALADLVQLAADKTQAANVVRHTNLAGTDVTYEIDRSHYMRAETGFQTVPGMANMNGQVGWFPKEGTVNGVIAFDGSVDPQFGIVDAPVMVYMKDGVIDRVEGGSTARDFDAYVRGFNHPQMLRPAHVCYGLHPGAQLSGQIDEDERVWGCTCWGFGSVGSCFVDGGVPAPSHIDLVALNSSTWLDDELIIENGEIVDPEMKALAAKLGK